MTRAKKTVLAVAIVVFLLAMLTIQGIYWFLDVGWGAWHQPYVEFIEYDNLQTVMANDVVYFSEDFLSDYDVGGIKLSLDSQFIGSGEVLIVYDPSNVGYNVDFSGRVKDLDYCCYRLDSKEDCKDIPISIIVKMYKANGNYSMFEYNEYADENENCMQFKTEVKPRTFVKRILSLTVVINEDVADGYTAQQKQERAEKVFKSAVDNIVKYQG